MIKSYLNEVLIGPNQPAKNTLEDTMRKMQEDQRRHNEFMRNNVLLQQQQQFKKNSNEILKKN
jgi:hypothetical protein